MISFENDYTTGAHPKILQRFIDSNFESLSGYGTDSYSKQARNKIKLACACPNADIYFLVGGTQTNTVIISSLLENYEGVITANTGHIQVHEAGAIERTGHKILTLPEQNGKILPEQLEQYLSSFYQDNNHEHMVFPGMVSISSPTSEYTDCSVSSPTPQQVPSISSQSLYPAFSSDKITPLTYSRRLGVASSIR